MGKKKINSTKVDEFGKVIKAHLPTWRKENPDALVFDSRTEWKHWRMLLDAGFKVALKITLELIPAINAKTLKHTPETLRELRRNIRDAVCAADKTTYRRLCNKNNKQEIFDAAFSSATWTPDFYLPEYNMYIESKGFENDAFPLKLKMARHLFPQNDFIVVSTLKDMSDLIDFLKIKGTNQ